MRTKKTTSDAIFFSKITYSNKSCLAFFSLNTIYAKILEERPSAHDYRIALSLFLTYFRPSCPPLLINMPALSPYPQAIPFPDLARQRQCPQTSLKLKVLVNLNLEFVKLFVEGADQIFTEFCLGMSRFRFSSALTPSSENMGSVR